MKIRNLRWGIAVLLLLASILNYVDRQTLSILAPTIQADLRISDEEYGHIVSLFLVAYTVAYLLSGRIVDALGPRVSMALFVGWWSLANMLTGFAKSFASLGAFRFLLGLGEAGGYTASPKIVRQWFPPKDRGIAVGIYSVGGAIGATLAPVLVLAVTARYGWRGAFFATGALGLVFVALWLVVFRNPETHPWITDGEKSLILAGESAEVAQVKEPVLTEAARWRGIVSSRAVWALMLARLLTDPVWYFFQFWMPKYLHAERGFEQADLASMWMIYLAADVGFLGSGFISGRMIRGRCWVALFSCPWPRSSH
jgi:ACS family hexuronate transporter-like MFS transporter